MAELTRATDEVRETVRERYADAAKTATAGGEPSCGGGELLLRPDRNRPRPRQGFEDFGAGLYAGDERGELPDAAKLASLGCGNPTAVADLHEGETVLDLGSGGGIDVFLSAAGSAPPARPTAST